MNMKAYGEKLCLKYSPRTPKGLPFEQFGFNTCVSDVG